MENKSLDSLNIKSLYTNISVNKCIEHLEIHLKTNITFPLPVNKIVKNLHIIYEALIFQYNYVLSTKI